MRRRVAGSQARSAAYVPRTTGDTSWMRAGLGSLASASIILFSLLTDTPEALVWDSGYEEEVLGKSMALRSLGWISYVGLHLIIWRRDAYRTIVIALPKTTSSAGSKREARRLFPSIPATNRNEGILRSNQCQNCERPTLSDRSSRAKKASLARQIPCLHLAPLWAASVPSGIKRQPRRMSCPSSSPLLKPLLGSW